MRILLVEDERAAARVIAQGLREQSYAVDVAEDGESALACAAGTDYDVIVLDVMLPNRNGLDVCHTLRARGSMVPVLMLTARDEVEARIAGLDAGADGYLTKPFDFGELLARVRALGRRRSVPVLPEAFAFGPLQLNTRTREARLNGRLIALTAREYAFLEYLCRMHGAVVTREEIAARVWDGRYDPASNVIDVYVQRLRGKIDRPGLASYIRTRRGIGYQLLVQDVPS